MPDPDRDEIDALNDGLDMLSALTALFAEMPRNHTICIKADHFGSLLGEIEAKTVRGAVALGVRFTD